MMAENYIYMQEIQVVKGMVEAGVFGEVYFGEGSTFTTLKHGYIQLWAVYERKTSWRKYWQFGRRSLYPTHSLGPVMKWLHGDRIKTVRTVGTDSGPLLICATTTWL